METFNPKNEIDNQPWVYCWRVVPVMVAGTLGPAHKRWSASCQVIPHALMALLKVTMLLGTCPEITVPEAGQRMSQGSMEASFENRDFCRRMLSSPKLGLHQLDVGLQHQKNSIFHPQTLCSWTKNWRWRNSTNQNWHFSNGGNGRNLMKTSTDWS